MILSCTDALELVESVVAEFTSREKETSLQHTQRVGQRDGVEVLALDFCDQIFIMADVNFVEIAVFGLDQEEKEILELVRSVRNDEQTLFLQNEK